MLPVPPIFPADPFVAAGDFERGVCEQNAAELPPVPVDHVVAQIQTDAMSVAPRIVALDPFVSLPDLFPVGHHPQGQRLETGKAGFDSRLGIGQRSELRWPLGPKERAVPQGRQLQEPALLRILERAAGQLDWVDSLGCLPFQLLANCLRKFHAADLREQPDGLADVSNLLTGQELAAERSGLKTVSAKFHGWSWSVINYIL